jgi:hypothetical protein
MTANFIGYLVTQTALFQQQAKAGEQSCGTSLRDDHIPLIKPKVPAYFRLYQDIEEQYSHCAAA